MRRLAVLAALALAVAAPAHDASARAGRAPAPAAAAKTCRGGYVRGVIGGEVKCLHRGEYCAVRYARQYPRYGFRCSGSPARLR
jgi:hypothetical protein